MTRPIRAGSAALAASLALLGLGACGWMGGPDAEAAPPRQVPRPDLPTEGPAAEVARDIQAMFDDIAEIGADPDVDADHKRLAVAWRMSEHLDYATLTRAALGPLAEKFTRDQYADFAHEYARFVTWSFARRPSASRGVPIIVQTAAYEADKGLVLLEARGVALASGYPAVRRMRSLEPTRIALTLAKRHGDWLVGRVVLEGVDVSLTFRAQFRSVLGRSDPDALIAELRERNEANIPHDG
jgi:ABC-type transporter MlaC component